jgi:hypothetical protein
MLMLVLLLGRFSAICTLYCPALMHHALVGGALVGVNHSGDVEHSPTELPPMLAGGWVIAPGTPDGVRLTGLMLRRLESHCRAHGLYGCPSGLPMLYPVALLLAVFIGLDLGDQ